MEFDYKKLLNKAMERMPKKELSSNRFKLPDANSEVQGNKTILKNFREISTVLRRSGTHLSKYLFKELATPGNMQGDMLILQTKVSNENLKSKIKKYVDEFVYCKVCGQPDTKLVKEDRILFMVCEACGARQPCRII